MAGLTVRGVRHRRVRSVHRRLACQFSDDSGFRSGRTGTGAIHPAAG